MIECSGSDVRPRVVVVVVVEGHNINNILN